jgi:hypothetical protein
MKISKLRTFVLLLLAFAVPGAAAFATAGDENIRSDKFTLYYVPGETKGSPETYIAEGEPPLVKDVITIPAEPGMNDTVIVEARIANDPMRTQSRPIEASLFYSKDNYKTWYEIEMDEDNDVPELWRAEVPPTGKPAKISYFITAKDDSGNMVLELPEIPIEWGGINPPVFTGSVTDKNDDPRLVPNDLDILAAKVGFDGKRLYFGIRVEGGISSGTVSPFNAYVYSVGIYYPDTIDDGSIKTDMVLIHAQHAQFLRFPVIGLLNTERDLAEMPSADARYYTDHDWLYMTFRTDVLKKEGFKRLRMIFGTAYASEYQPEVILKPVDATMFINIVRSDRSYEVK